MAILEASIEVHGGSYTPVQLETLVNKQGTLELTLSLLNLTYEHPAKDLLSVVKNCLINLPGGKKWLDI